MSYLIGPRITRDEFDIESKKPGVVWICKSDKVKIFNNILENKTWIFGESFEDLINESELLVGGVESK